MKVAKWLQAFVSLAVLSGCGGDGQQPLTGSSKIQGLWKGLRNEVGVVGTLPAVPVGVDLLLAVNGTFQLREVAAGKLAQGTWTELADTSGLILSIGTSSISSFGFQGSTRDFQSELQDPNLKLTSARAVYELERQDDTRPVEIAMDGMWVCGSESGSPWRLMIDGEKFWLSLIDNKKHSMVFAEGSLRYMDTGGRGKTGERLARETPAGIWQARLEVEEGVPDKPFEWVEARMEVLEDGRILMEVAPVDEDGGQLKGHGAVDCSGV